MTLILRYINFTGPFKSINLATLTHRALHKNVTLYIIFSILEIGFHTESLPTHSHSPSRSLPLRSFVVSIRNLRYLVTPITLRRFGQCEEQNTSCQPHHSPRKTLNASSTSNRTIPRAMGRQNSPD